MRKALSIFWLDYCCLSFTKPSQQSSPGWFYFDPGCSILACFGPLAYFHRLQIKNQAKQLTQLVHLGAPTSSSFVGLVEADLLGQRLVQLNPYFWCKDFDIRNFDRWEPLHQK